MYQKRVVLKKEGSEVWCLDSNQLFHILFVKSLSRFCRRKYLVSSYFTIFVKLRTEREIFITLACQRGAD